MNDKVNMAMVDTTDIKHVIKELRILNTKILVSLENEELGVIPSLEKLIENLHSSSDEFKNLLGIYKDDISIPLNNTNKNNKEIIKDINLVIDRFENFSVQLDEKLSRTEAAANLRIKELQDGIQEEIKNLGKVLGLVIEKSTKSEINKHLNSSISEFNTLERNIQNILKKVDRNQLQYLVDNIDLLKKEKVIFTRERFILNSLIFFFVKG